MARGTRSRSKKDEATTQVDDRTTAVDQAAAASVAADAPEPASSVTDAVAAGTVTEIGSTQELDAQLDGQDLELSEEQQAEVIPTPDEDADASFGLPSVEELKDRKLGEDLLGTDGDPNAPSDDPRENLEASKDFNPFGSVSTADIDAPDAKEAGVFDLLQDPGAGGDPLSSFLGAVEAKLGRDVGAAPSDQTNASPAHGKQSVADAGAPHPPPDDPPPVVKVSPDGKVVSFEYESGLKAVGNVDNDTTTLLLPDGSTRTVQTSTGNVLDETPPLTQPDPENEGAPLPEIFQRQLDAEVARLRGLKGETGDGVTDPTDSPVEVIDPSATLPSHTEQGRELFGQPDETAPSGSDANFNPGADSTGAGVITPSDDKDVTAGPTRNDDPFADAGTAPEPVSNSNAVPTDVESFLPSETTGTAIDDTPDLPDPISDPV